MKRNGIPYDKSSKIFRRENIANGKLYAAVDLAFGKCVNWEDKESKKNWKKLMRLYVEVMGYLCLSREYVDGELEDLETRCDELSNLFVHECGGMVNVTNYFHDLISGHVVQMSQMYGNLWRYRNEGVEAMNAIISRRRNCFSNNGGAKRSRRGEKKRKFRPVESLGNWRLRTAAWQTGIGDECFMSKAHLCKLESVQCDDQLTRLIAEDLGSEDDEVEYHLDEEWIPESDSGNEEEDCNSESDYDSEDLDHPEDTLPAANNARNVKTEKRLKYENLSCSPPFSFAPMPGTPVPHN